MKAKDRVLIKNLAATAEVVNTINGGMASPVISVFKGKLEWTINARVPGVSPENLKLEIKDNELYIFQMIKNGFGEMELPYMLTMINLSNRIELDAITAEYENGELFIVLPLDEMSDGFFREIEIVKR
ncbi:MAG: HSP20 family molecular chaperone IbpA [Cyclobacteriaceae bacterium]|jgi:HSP20 family molecular chaperone IbpA